MRIDNHHTWFVDVRGNAKANRAVAEMLPQRPENECLEMKCEDGVTRNLWELPSYRFVSQIKHFCIDNGLKCGFYVRQGRHGKVRTWSFAFHDLGSASRKRQKKNKGPLLHEKAEALVHAA